MDAPAELSRRVIHPPVVNDPVVQPGTPEHVAWAAEQGAKNRAWEAKFRLEQERKGMPGPHIRSSKHG
jgi:hypothetical protein